MTGSSMSPAKNFALTDCAGKHKSLLLKARKRKGLLPSSSCVLGHRMRISLRFGIHFVVIRGRATRTLPIAGSVGNAWTGESGTVVVAINAHMASLCHAMAVVA
jgi:hypothetical protein